MLLEAFTIFLGGFLLFQIQPIVGAAILPWFGGTAAVWTTCLLFFQSALLLGYGYAHAVVRPLTPGRQVVVHGLVLGTSLLTLPVIPDPAWKPIGSEAPIVRILGLLTTTVGLPYVLLATTGPIVQSWLVRRDPVARPYRLFALGNLASLAGLLGYPFLVRPVLSLGAQLRWWSVLYGVYAALCAFLAFRARPIGGDPGLVDSPAARAAPSVVDPPSAGERVLWVALATCPSILLLAMTNHLTTNVAPVPLLWVLPLSVYLFSFVACFEHDRWYRRGIYLPLSLAAFCTVELATSGCGEGLGVVTSTALLTASLWVLCMACHGELAALRPDPRHLTSFYLMIAVGGAAGGVFVAILAPYLFHSYLELPVGLAGSLLLLMLVLHRERPLARHRRGRVLLAAVGAVLAAYLGAKVYVARDGARVSVRNFYGVLRVVDIDSPAGRRRVLAHGVVDHGEQFLEPARRREGTAYYARGSGVQIVIERVARRGPIHLGVIGLGAGVLAVYGRRGDRLRFYEINPLVVDLARTEFTFLEDSAAATDVVVGDGRLLLEREPPQHFDVLVLDAFSGDAIPVHLLTREAFGVYVRHLAPNGVLLVNASNRYLDLQPVVAQSARAWQREAILLRSAADPQRGASRANWIAVTGDRALLEELRARGGTIAPNLRDVRPWTDDYSDLLQVLR